MKKSIYLGVLLLVLLVPVFVSANPAAPGKDMVVQLRLYEGFRGENGQPEKVISSYYLKQLSHEDIPLDADAPKEKETLARVFRLTDIKPMTEAILYLKKEWNKTPFQVIVLNGRKLLVQLSGLPGQGDQFRVEVFEDSQPPRSLLETKIILPQLKSSVLGFEDAAGHIYFLSFHRRKDEISPSPPLSPVKVKPDKSPRLVRKVDPQYPEEALKKHIDGKVVIEATTNIDGDVVDAKVLEGHALLAKAAVDAVQQWKYEPYYLEGKKKPVQFTVVLNFRLKKEKKPEQPHAISSVQKPKLVKKVEPIYPEEAVKAKVDGKVVIEATADAAGKVVDAVVIDGHPMLNDAALAAIKQWVYEPFVIDGVKKPVKFTVVMRFGLKDKDQKIQEKKQ